MRYKESGGVSLIDQTTASLRGHDHDLLEDNHAVAVRKMAEKTGLNIILGAGWYREPYYEKKLYRMKTDEIADELINDIKIGIDGTDVKAGILGEIGFMVPFAAADYTKGECWKRIMGNASDWGFGPMFGQSEDEEIISYLPEGSLGSETKIAEAASERVQALADPQNTFRKDRIGMDPKRF